MNVNVKESKSVGSIEKRRKKNWSLHTAKTTKGEERVATVITITTART